MPSYNVQLVTDTTHGLVVKVEAPTDAIDHRQLEPTVNRCQQTLGCRPQQIVADGDYTNHASVQAAAAAEWDFYGSWQESWKPVERDAQGRSAAFLGGAFPYDAEQDCFTCPAGQTALRWRKMTSQKRFNNGRPLSLRIPRASAPSGEDGVVQPFAAEVGDVLHERHDQRMRMALA